MGGAYGLDYVALYKVAETLGVEIDEEVLGLVQVLEAEQVEEWNEQSERTKAVGAKAPGKLKGAVKRG